MNKWFNQHQIRNSTPVAKIGFSCMPLIKKEPPSTSGEAYDACNDIIIMDIPNKKRIFWRFVIDQVNAQTKVYHRH